MEKHRFERYCILLIFFLASFTGYGAETTSHPCWFGSSEPFIQHKHIFCSDGNPGKLTLLSETGFPLLKEKKKYKFRIRFKGSDVRFEPVYTESREHLAEDQAVLHHPLPAAICCENRITAYILRGPPSKS